MTSFERITCYLCITFLASVTIVAMTIAGLAGLAPSSPDAIPSPVVIDGPVEPILRYDTMCPPPELRGGRGEPEPGLHLGGDDEGEECQP